MESNFSALSLIVILPYIVAGVLSGMLFGFFCQHLADEKGRSGGAWFLLGFFFSLPALIAIAGLPVKENAKWMARNQRSSDLFRRCPYCYEYILKGATRCRFCSSKIELTS
jgi:hypothetical protein